MIGVMDNHCVGIGDIQTGFNDCCGNKHINIPVDKIQHDLLQLVLSHLSVGKDNRCLRHQSRNAVCHLDNIVYPIINVIYLAAPRHFPMYRLPNHFFIVFHHIGLNRNPVYRRFFQHAHIPDTCQAHMKGSGNRSCRQSQDINIFL